MRAKSLLIYLKINALKNIVIERINFFLNLCIFLSIFAITSTAISVYYEFKINKIEKEIYENNLLIDIASLNINLLPKNINSLENHIDEQINVKNIIDFFYFSKLGTIFSKRDQYYMPVLNLMMYLDKGFADFEVFKGYAKQDKLKGVNDEFKKLTKIISSQKEKYNQIVTQIKKQHEKNTFTQGGMKTVKDNEGFYKNYQKYYNEMIDYTKDQITFYIKSITIIRNLIDETKNENIQLRKKISEQSKIASNMVLVAFIMQLFIFFIIQMLEYKTTRDEIDETRNFK